MSRARRGPTALVTGALVAGALLLPLAGCGKYGKPVRKSRAFAAGSQAEPAGALAGGPAARPSGPEEKKPGAR